MYRRHAAYQEAQLSSEVSQFLEKNQDHSGTINSESQILTGHKCSAEKSVGYARDIVTKEQQVDGNYEGVKSAFPKAADLVHCNTVISIYLKF